MLIAAACGTWLACDPLSPPRLPPLDARSLPLPLLLNWICLLLAAFAWTPALAQPEPGQPLSALEESSLQQSLEIEDRDWARPVEAAEKLSALVEVLPDVQELSGVMWAHVIATKNGRKLEGWILQSVLTTATPVPNWEPTATETPAPSETLEVTPAP